MMLRTLILSFVLFTHIIVAQEFDKGKMDSFFEILEKHEQSMGTFSIYKNGVEVYSNSIGYLDIESKKDAQVDSKYRVGSISKMFTAAIIMKLVESKKLKLSTPLTRFFPRIKNSSRISIESMLNHSSGIYNFTNTDEYLTYQYKPLSRDELYQRILEFGSSFDPGEKADYSNSNYVLLSIIAEKVTKKSFDELIQEMICKPIGLQDTYFGGKISTSNNETSSYKKVKKWERQKETDMSILLGAGAVVSTASDINKFLNAFFNDKIVTSDSRKKMMKIENGYGLGLFKTPYESKVSYGHNGGIDGFQSMAYYMPEENVSITYLSNGTDYDVKSIFLDALGIYFNKGKDLPSFLPVMKLKESDLDKYLGKYKSDSLPIELNIFKSGANLVGQATGQQDFILDAFDVHKFKFEPGRLEIEFFPAESRLVLIQGGKEYKMIRE